MPSRRGSSTASIAACCSFVDGAEVGSLTVTRNVSAIAFYGMSLMRPNKVERIRVAVLINNTKLLIGGAKLAVYFLVIIISSIFNDISFFMMMLYMHNWCW